MSNGSFEVVLKCATSHGLGCLMKFVPDCGRAYEPFHGTNHVRNSDRDRLIYRVKRINQ